MHKNNVAIEDAPAALALTPDKVSQIKKEDMKQAIFARFSSGSEAVTPSASTRGRQRSPYWQPADDQC